jgi:two-component system sensor histidine kinase QseC
MRAWMGPSISRRLLGSLLLAFVLVWGALLLLYWQRWLQGREARVQETVEQVLALLTPDQTPAEALLRVQTVDELSAIGLRQAGQGTVAGFILRDLSRPDAAPLYVAAGLREQTALRWTLAGACELPGRDCIHRQAHNTRWALHRISLPMRNSEVFAGIHAALLPLLLLAFPLVFLPLGLAVWRGLAPLNRLGTELARRQPQDLAPLPEPILRDLRYREMQPLLHALQGLMQRLRGHLARERAFVEDAAHELRTPMARISAQAHVLRMAGSDEAREQASRQLEAGVARASHVVEQLLALARLEAAAPTTLQSLDLAEWLREQLAAQLPAAETAGIELSLDAPERWPLQTEPQALASIVGNLVENAIRYAGAGAELVLQLHPGPPLELWVQDNGPGIAPEAQEKIFERFQRGEQRGADGSGLGLAIVQQACERLGLRLVLESPCLENGRGCRFRLIWPP